MRKFSLISAFVLASISLQPALAQKTGAYVGVDMGTAGNSNIAGICTRVAGAGTIKTCEDKIITTRLKFGVQATDTFGIETSYYQTGSLNAAVDRTGITNLYVKNTSFGIALRGRFHVAEKLWANAKIGAHKWEQKATYSGKDGAEHAARFYGDGFDIMYGGGLDYYFNDNMSFQLGIDQLGGGTVADTRYIFGGISYTF